MSKSSLFSNGDYVVYPAHGVGQIKSVEVQEIAGQKLEVFVISFDRDRMTLRLPLLKAKTSGLRSVCNSKEISNAISVLKTRGRTRRAMWSRRAQEYAAKINSGDLTSVAEVVRELYRTASQPEQSYSERQVYQDALSRFVGELAVVEKIDEQKAIEKVEQILEAA